MKRSLSFLFFCSVAAVLPSSRAAPPNAIIIMAGRSGVSGPRLLRLAQDQDAPHRPYGQGRHAGHRLLLGRPGLYPIPVAALLTGCYAKRVGDLGVLFPRDKQGLNPDEVTIADLLKTKGYATACIGKWHLGHLKDFCPPTKVSILLRGSVQQRHDHRHLPNLYCQRRRVTGRGYLGEHQEPGEETRVPARDTKIIEYPADQNTLTKALHRGSDCLHQKEQGEALLRLPHTMPHISPLCDSQFEGESEIGLYGDTIEEPRLSTGQILETLRKLKLDQNTLVIYTSDNGPWKLSSNSWVKGNMNRRVGGFAHPLSKAIVSRFEGGDAVPTLMWWPGRIPAGRVCSEVGAERIFYHPRSDLRGQDAR